jgi:hypothetical protein
MIQYDRRRHHMVVCDGIVVYVYISRISMVGSVGFVPSGTSGDN